DRGGGGGREGRPQLLEGAVEVLDRLGQVARLEERDGYVALQQRPLRRVGRLAVEQQVDARRLAEVVERLAGRRGPRRQVARLEEMRLRLLEVLGTAVVVGEHAVELGESVGEECLDRLREGGVRL